MALIVIAETGAAAIDSLDEIAAPAEARNKLNFSERKCQDLLFNSDVAKELRLQMYEKCLDTNFDTNSVKLGFGSNDGSGEEIDSYRRGSGSGGSSGGGGSSGRRNSASTNSISVVTCILMFFFAKFLID